MASLLERAATPLGRRRYLVGVVDDPAADLVARALEGHFHPVPPGVWALLIEKSVKGFRALGSMHIAETASDSGPAVELSRLSLPADPWHKTGALTEGNLLLLHAGIRHARLRQAKVLSLLAEPSLLTSLVRATSFFCPEADRPAPEGLLWASARPSDGRVARGFEAVLVEGAGLGRLALFAQSLSPSRSASSPPLEATDCLASGPDLQAAAGR